MPLLAILIMTALKLYCLIGSSRVISMTFKTFGRSITIKNKKLADALIADKNTWGIATSAEKRNKMSLSGAFAYMLALPEIIFLVYDWYLFMKTAVVGWCPGEEPYLAVVTPYYIVGLLLNIHAANKFSKGELW